MIYTETDFERLSFHDCHIWAVELRPGDPDEGDWTSDLALDIDFIAEWICGVGGGQFRVAPATLVFHGVTDPKIDINWGCSGFQVALHPVSIATIAREWVPGAATQGISQMREALTAFEATGMGIWRSYYLALLGEAHARAGLIARGIVLLDEALGAVKDSGERYYEAELHRLKGELLTRAPGSKSADDGETCFRRAIEIARRQHAKSLELRAVTSLSRFWGRHGKAREARKLLADTYGWFSEGLDTPDLRDAEELLAALSRVGRRGARGGARASR